MINVCDTETTGFDPKDGGVCEIACVVVGDTIEFTEDGFMHSLVNPGCPIGFEAMGTHHISEDMVRDAPDLDTVVYNHGLEVYDVWAAHNADFDKGFMPEAIRAKRWICTWRCAMHLWPDAPSHKNQALRYWLGLDVSDMPAEAGGTAHRALYDAWVTAKLVKRQLDEVGGLLFPNGPQNSDISPIEYDQKCIEELLRLSSAPLVLKRVRFGKHRDQLWADVPHDYLRWCLRQGDMDADVHHTCRHHLGHLV